MVIAPIKAGTKTKSKTKRKRKTNIKPTKILGPQEAIDILNAWDNGMYQPGFASFRFAEHKKYAHEFQNNDNENDYDQELVNGTTNTKNDAVYNNVNDNGNTNPKNNNNTTSNSAAHPSKFDPFQNVLSAAAEAKLRAQTLAPIFQPFVVSLGEQVSMYCILQI